MDDRVVNRGKLWAGVAAVAGLTLVSASASAQTTIPGGNLGNQTWTQSNSPYIIQGDATVQAGATLTIEAGVEVRFSTSDNLGSGRDTSRPELTVAGSIDVNGTANSPVVFRSNVGSNAGSWYGIILTSTTTSASFDHARVEHGVDGLTTDAPGTTFTANHLILQNNSSDGLVIDAGTPSLNDVATLNNGAKGVTIASSAAATLTRLRSRGNSNGISITQTSATPQDTVLDYATVWSNSGDGVYLGGSGSYSRSVKVRNSIVVENGLDGIEKYYYSDSSVDITYSNVWGNGDDYDDTSPGTGSFGCNPLFVSPTDATLTERSPARKSSDVGTDLGALAYAGAPTPGLYGTLWEDTVLDAAGSPYTIDGDLAVGEGYTLTIESGAELRFNAGDTMQCGRDSSLGELKVDGTLVVQGTLSTPAVLRGASTSSGAWWGIDVREGGTANISGADIANAVNGVSHNSSTTLQLSYTDIHDGSGAGIDLSRGSAMLDGVKSYRNSKGLQVDSAAWFEATNMVLAQNQNGVQVTQTSSTPQSSTIHSSTIDGNSGDGVYLGGSGSYSRSLKIINSNVTNNGLDGIEKYYYSDSSVDITYSNVWSNGDDYDDTSAGTGCISANPFYTDTANLDYSLMMGSVCIDAGDGATAPDHDALGNARPADGDGVNGAAYDIGAYEYGAASQCGDGNTGPGEVCDDGANNGSYGYCLSDCSGLGARCGDGTVQSSHETCDDGADNGSYGFCNNTCDGQAAYCGDGTVNGNETCDDGSNNGSYGYCLGDCSDMGPYCGDDTINGNETCDDGSNNGSPGYCNANCTGQVASCGDGQVQSGEACDDGANNGQYGYCAADCSGPGPSCGDGTVNGNEACDDGNLSNTDDCLNTCEAPTCGDGYVHAEVEECDDANNDNTDACVEGCVAAVCGDSYVHQGVEGCDDGNDDNTDGCTDGCTLVSCGDGQVQPGEECDDGNSSNLDNCLNTCVRSSCGDGHQQPGEACDDGNDADNDACLSTCRNAACGDGIVHDGVEECDDGNGSNTDSCLVTCEAATCGDGYLEADVEECDDGNTDNGDGCSSACVVEAGDDVGTGGDAGTGADAGTGGDAGIDSDAGGADAGTGGDVGDGTGNVDQNAGAADEGCGCSSTSDSPAPGNAVYLGLVVLGLAGARLRRRR
ncbi:DUF4215 domain-containing protein [Persicimonas caeni]|uniref:DUF4215 domain-containing protein n=1 Tax=Persicimonas caeni TaxID=2292766 RepID=A0A4Y6PN79_PERCE|nr:DUF4215 domain-containing protein [Persicimonas caeni]QDG49477.1 DUF4215 domain-containing protein [Persicimonas caeni]QED30698.1 DUF4215 domain-containing protein [Persicimonas caeni]